MLSSHKIRFALVALLLSSGCASKAVKSGDESPLQVLDVHTHTHFTGKIDPSSGMPNTEEEYFREMREAGVTGGVSHTGHGGRGGEGWLPELKEHNIIQCFGVDAKVDAAALEEGLRSGKYGCIKIYLGYVHQWAYDKGYEPAYRLAEKYGVPVVFHTGDTYSTKGKLKYSDPMAVDEVAVDHPKVTFVIAHCGEPWIETAAEVAYKNPNVFLECSALVIGDYRKISPQHVEDYVVKPISWIFGYLEDPSKLMYGTDWPLSQMKNYLEAYKRAIPREHWQAVFHDNAARIFKLK